LKFPVGPAQTVRRGCARRRSAQGTPLAGVFVLPVRGVVPSDEVPDALTDLKEETSVGHPIFTFRIIAAMSLSKSCGWEQHHFSRPLPLTIASAPGKEPPKRQPIAGWSCTAHPSMRRALALRSCPSPHPIFLTDSTYYGLERSGEPINTIFMA
jgi:hypothetical protein